MKKIIILIQKVNHNILSELGFFALKNAFKNISDNIAVFDVPAKIVRKLNNDKY